MEKEERFEFRMLPEDRKKLDELAAYHKEKRAVVLRDLIRKAHFELEYNKSRVSAGT